MPISLIYPQLQKSFYMCFRTTHHYNKKYKDNIAITIWIWGQLQKQSSKKLHHHLLDIMWVSSSRIFFVCVAFFSDYNFSLCWVELQGTVSYCGLHKTNSYLVIAVR